MKDELLELNHPFFQGGHVVFEHFEAGDVALEGHGLASNGFSRNGLGTRQGEVERLFRDWLWGDVGIQC